MANANDNRSPVERVTLTRSQLCEPAMQNQPMPKRRDLPDDAEMAARREIGHAAALETCELLELLASPEFGPDKISDRPAALRSILKRLDTLNAIQLDALAARDDAGTRSAEELRAEYEGY